MTVCCSVSICGNLKRGVCSWPRIISRCACSLDDQDLFMGFYDAIIKAHTAVSPLYIYIHSPIMLRSVFSLIVLVGYASAQLRLVLTMDPTSHFSWYFIDDSNGCLTALTYTIGNPASQLCLGGESALTTLLAALAASTSSIIPDINYWLTGLCNSPECSEDTLADVVHNITNGCLAELNLPAPTIANLTNTVEQLYPTARYIMCLEE